MSIISGRSSLVSIVRNSLNRRSSLASAKCHISPHRVESALTDFLQNHDSRSYEELVCVLRDCSLSDDDVSVVLTECSTCVGFLDKDARLLVEVLCSLDWPSRPQKIVDHYCQWLLDLLTAQIYHAPVAIGSLVKLLAKNENVWCESPSAEQTRIFSNIHSLIARVVATIPMSGEVLLRCVIDNYPYYKHSMAVQQAYVHNLLWITRYLPALTDHILTLILNRLIVMDVNVRPQEFDEGGGGVFSMEEDAGNDSSHLIESLDLCMLELFQWINQEGSKALDILFNVFERTILPTHGTRYIQFLLFYGLSVDKGRISNLLETLWLLAASARVGPGLRQASIAHLGGLLARANFVPVVYLHNYMKKMADWCHSYIQAQESWNPNLGKNPHSVFYCVSQSLFYLIAFKHNYIFSNKKGLVFVESLNLSKLVMSSLNPLRMCQTSVAEAFASITRMYQVVYCHTIMEHNTRHYLRIDESTKEQDWFPYDPYTLPKSFHWIKPIYGEYQDTINDSTSKSYTDGGCDEDDFLATSPNSELAQSLSKCSFTTFRHL